MDQQERLELSLVQIDILKEAVQQGQERVAELTDDLRACETDRDTWRSRIVKEIEARTLIEQQREGLERECLAMAKQVEQIREDSMRRSEAVRRETLVEASTELAKLQNELDDSRAEADLLAEERDTSRIECDKLSAKVKSLEEECRKWRAAYHASNSNLAQSRSTYDRPSDEAFRKRFDLPVTEFSTVSFSCCDSQLHAGTLHVTPSFIAWEPTAVSGGEQIIVSIPEIVAVNKLPKGMFGMKGLDCEVHTLEGTTHVFRALMNRKEALLNILLQARKFDHRITLLRDGQEDSQRWGLDDPNESND